MALYLQYNFQIVQLGCQFWAIWPAALQTIIHDEIK
ncbi:hypothetical protein HMPREF0018_00401 [Acinetobacter radioresistens SH164]|nr:hypothetical protein HMPREF0018_00401 [Acinetobacter radioresistens SH164]